MSQRKAIWGWFFYDWASQPFHTLLMTFVFGPYFAIVASQYYMGLGQEETLADANAQIVWSNCLAITGFIIGFGGRGTNTVCSFFTLNRLVMPEMNDSGHL